MSSCYSSWKIAKTGEAVPCFTNGKPSASMYNPQREAEQFAQLLNEGFNVIVGYASGLHVKESLSQHKNGKIIVVEKNTETIHFLLSNKDIIIPKHIHLCTVEELDSVIINEYFPPIDGNFSVVPLRSWVEANPTTFEDIKIRVQSTLKDISADVSTQAHFGKLWHRNIIQNLSICEQSGYARLLDIRKSQFPTAKTAFIAGAGPGLEDCFNELKTNREQYYIISTDTAYHSLTEQGIVSDVVVSIDAQHISHSHFMCEKNQNTIFAFDLCANPVAAKSLIRENYTICYFKSNHPLCTFVDNWYKSKYQSNFFPTITSTGGTVTLSALNFARKVGFTKYYTGGCDFAYSNGKMYSKGIYMDTIFNSISNKLKTTENLFASLFFRAPLIIEEKSKTTELLRTYKRSFDAFFTQERGKITSVDTNEASLAIKSSSFPAKQFLQEYCEILHNGMDSKKEQCFIEVTLYPYLAWYVSTNAVPVNRAKICEIGLNATVHY